MTDLRFAVLGCGFWARYQIAAWLQAGGVNLIAVYNRTRSKAEAMAEALGVPSVYDDARALFESETLDFVDVITSPETHSRFVRLAAICKVPVICHKPMAPTRRSRLDVWTMSLPMKPKAPARVWSKMNQTMWGCASDWEARNSSRVF